MQGKQNLSQEPQEPHCHECGSEDLRYLETYANGEEWKCRMCGTEQIFEEQAP